MKKFLSVLAVLGIISSAGIQSANAFCWSKLNPWSKCKCKNTCEQQVPQYPTGYASPCDTKIPCDPCDKQITKPTPCEPCDRLQQHVMDNK
jgi:hypothetical protein